MLAVVVLWTVAPAFACLLAMQPAGQPACCRGMMHNCGSMGMEMSGSCCSARPQDVAVAPVPPYAPEQAQMLAIAPHHTSLPTLSTPATARRNGFEAPPPIFSSSGSFILRI